MEDVEQANPLTDEEKSELNELAKRVEALETLVERLSKQVQLS